MDPDYEGDYGYDGDDYGYDGDDGCYDDGGHEYGGYDDNCGGGDVEPVGDGGEMKLDGARMVGPDGEGGDPRMYYDYAGGEDYHGGGWESGSYRADVTGDGDYIVDGYDYDSDGSVYVEFDGASKGNPGPAGAGAVIRSRDGTVLARACKGIGNATNNEAEYEGLKEGLKTALEMGYSRVHAQGDSKLVAKQVQGNWKTRNERMAKHCNEACQLMDQFESADIGYVPRGHNSEADAEANKGVNLPAGKVCKYGPLYGGGGGR
ncbi:putative carbonic anhydrase 2 [Iris pallida]|uniref:Carbonic anhydrase 2 n=1 Tax=Iris pallida TaxID=29817 RepID=A0AAX6F217_IRIPA|nr:putative carbonic anhydrase 2 [Iris pallida]